MEQTIIQIGNSVGIIIPKALSKNGLKPGEKVIVEKDPASETYIISKNKKTSMSSITPHFFAVVDRVNAQYGKALREIARR
ncbi:MAG: hypothetical protein Q7S38_01755 [bacterium]|nr:hypothetical protein [bacterium]